MKGRQRWMALLLSILAIASIFVVVFVGSRRAHLFAPAWSTVDENHRTVVNLHPSSTIKLGKTEKRCTHFTCFDVYRCNSGRADHLSVYFYPETALLRNGTHRHIKTSTLFQDIREHFRQSRFYTGDLLNACIVIPPVDLLFPNPLRMRNDSALLSLLPGWNGGSSHLIFTFQPRVHRLADFHLGKAVIACPVLTKTDYRDGFDISIPFYYPTPAPKAAAKSERRDRKWLLAVLTEETPGSSTPDAIRDFRPASDVLFLEICTSSGQGFRSCSLEDSIYPDILLDVQFCLATSSVQQFLWRDLLLWGCIPVITDADVVLPFSEVLDWNRFAVFLQPCRYSDNINFLRQLDSDTRSRLRRSAMFVAQSYFVSPTAIFDMVLEILNSRLNPTHARSYMEWNVALTKIRLLPGIVPKNPGFTAVILTYNREANLPVLMTLLERCPSLQKIVIIWNNQVNSPPSEQSWPTLTVAREVIRTNSNRLSNRFYPYDAIPTDAVFSLDDDILILTPDEIEFGFQVWSENSDRLVGFPSRLHSWNSTKSKWEYDAEWGSRLSMVLTGASFYSQLYNYYYTFKMPRAIIKHIDDQMNCEDIAMNFLVANLTGKCPIKAGPRKKFRCPECSNRDMLLADYGHLLQRSQCVNYLAAQFGFMPLMATEFRADPVLSYEADIPSDRRYPGIGAL